MMSKLLISSDHHANWDALEYWFKYASKNSLPFVIAGDIVGDYNFEELANKKGLKLPAFYLDNIVTRELKKLFSDIVKFHAKKLAYFIDKYEVHTFFLHGNHEPIYFADEVKKYLKNKTLFFDLNNIKGLVNVTDLKLQV